MKRNTLLTAVLIALLILLGVIVYLRAEQASREIAVEAAPVTTPVPTPDPLDTIDPTPTPAPTPGEITPASEQPIISQPPQGRYGDLYLDADEIETLARLVKLEAGGECFEGQQAVAEVVLNRVLSPSYPNNVYDVIYQVGQFTPAGNIPYTVASQTQYDAVNAALNGPNILPQQVLYFAQGMNGRTEAWGRIGGHVFCY